MNQSELLMAVGAASKTPNDLVMVRTEDGTLHSVKSVTSETHDDADGSTTIWVDVEEH